MTGWVGSREGKRGREGGRGDMEEGCAGGGAWLCFYRGHTKKRNGMVNLAQQRKKKNLK